VDKPIYFTHHARAKFAVLAEIGLTVTEDQIADVVHRPDSIDSRKWLPIAQKSIDERHVLRVVFVEEVDKIRVITFYPGRKSRYETEDDL